MILKQLEEKEPLPDKEKDQMAWVRAAISTERLQKRLSERIDLCLNECDEVVECDLISV